MFEVAPNMFEVAPASLAILASFVNPRVAAASFVRQDPRQSGPFFGG